jgi:hypothetical protein
LILAQSAFNAATIEMREWFFPMKEGILEKHFASIRHLSIWLSKHFDNKYFIISTAFYIIFTVILYLDPGTLKYLRLPLNLILCYLASFTISAFAWYLIEQEDQYDKVQHAFRVSTLNILPFGYALMVLADHILAIIELIIGEHSTQWISRPLSQYEANYLLFSTIFVLLSFVTGWIRLLTFRLINGAAEEGRSKDATNYSDKIPGLSKARDISHETWHSKSRMRRVVQ